MQGLLMFANCRMILPNNWNLNQPEAILNILARQKHRNQLSCTTIDSRNSQFLFNILLIICPAIFNQFSSSSPNEDQVKNVDGLNIRHELIGERFLRRVHSLF